MRAQRRDIGRKWGDLKKKKKKKKKKKECRRRKKNKSYEDLPRAAPIPFIYLLLFFLSPICRRWPPISRLIR